MTIRRMEAAELLSLNKFTVAEEMPHIILDKEICKGCQDRPCLIVCPAVLYKLDSNQEISFDYAGCLECGTCRIICPNRGIASWNYPRGTFGVSFRYG